MIVAAGQTFGFLAPATNNMVMGLWGKIIIFDVINHFKKYHLFSGKNFKTAINPRSVVRLMEFFGNGIG